MNTALSFFHLLPLWAWPLVAVLGVVGTLALILGAIALLLAEAERSLWFLAGSLRAISAARREWRLLRRPRENATEEAAPEADVVPLAIARRRPL